MNCFLELNNLIVVSINMNEWDMQNNMTSTCGALGAPLFQSIEKYTRLGYLHI